MEVTVLRCTSALATVVFPRTNLRPAELRYGDEVETDTAYEVTCGTVEQVT